MGASDNEGNVGWLKEARSRGVRARLNVLTLSREQIITL